jgi:hypothetical protein
MSYSIPYTRCPGFRPVNDLVPGNEFSDNPVEFDLAPAWGADLARVRSIITASIGLGQNGDWSPEVQKAVISSFEHGAPAFINTIEAVRGLTVPAVMAHRAGIIPSVPHKPGTTTPDYDLQVPIVTGRQFSRVCGAVPAMALNVAIKISQLTSEAQAATDTRFFEQPSGSGGTGTRPRTAGNATAARTTTRRRGTAGKRGKTAKRTPTGSGTPGTSRPSESASNGQDPTGH